MPIDPVAAIALSLVISFVIIDAGLHKLRAIAHYGAIIEDYRLLPRAASEPAAVAVGAAEVLTGAAVLLPPLHRAALLAAALLFALYFAAMAVNLARGRRSIDCGCAGPGHRQSLSGALLARNAVLIATAVWLASGELLARPTGWFDWSVAFCAAVTGLLFYATLNLLLSNKELLAHLK